MLSLSQGVFSELVSVGLELGTFELGSLESGSILGLECNLYF